VRGWSERAVYSAAVRDCAVNRASNLSHVFEQWSAFVMFNVVADAIVVIQQICGCVDCSGCRCDEAEMWVCGLQWLSV
jgi:hypothetical protein